MTEQRIIKKYPNRRLYDTAISSYITLEDVKRLVLDAVPLTVIDARSQSDITHGTLLQIIVEQEEKGPHLFSSDMLQTMIRVYQGQNPALFNAMMVQGVALFSHYEQQQANAEQATGTADWQVFQSQWFDRFQQLVAEVKTSPEAPAEEETQTTMQKVAE